LNAAGKFLSAPKRRERNFQAQLVVIRIDCIAIDMKQTGGFACRKVFSKALYYFANLVSA
jgi:hypothetical protein